MYGCRLAVHLRQRSLSVVVLEKGRSLLGRASYANQARVHHGYHYPRSLLTALRSRANYARFADEYRDCIDRNFTKYYAVSRVFSKLSATQFKTFCKRIGLPLEPAPAEIRKLFNRVLIEDVFRTDECAFDAVKLQQMLGSSLLCSGVTVRKGCRVLSVEPGHRELAVSFEQEGQSRRVFGRTVYNCTYSEINRLLRASGLAGVPLKHEIAELALVETPPILRNVGITVMDGPFFSMMPFPARGLHTLSHVRYTPGESWQDRDGSESPYGRLERQAPVSRYSRMIRDAERYVPALRDCRYVDSLREVKTVLPASEFDDSRPILFHRDAQMPQLASLLGGKIDNIYDVLSEVDGKLPAVAHN
jgi:glycine/D-amino acid oxidase-like deaminating enzyme